MVDTAQEQSERDEQIVGEVAHLLRGVNCPACDFDLRGNPTTKKCPECGFMNEPEATWFRPSGILHVVSPYAMALLLGGLVCLWCIQAVRGFPAWTPVDRVVMGVALSCPVLFLLRRWKYHFPYEFLLIGKTKIHWRVSGRPEVAIDWADIERVSGSRFLDQVCLRQCGSRYSVRLPRCLRPKSMGLDQLIDIVRGCWEEGSKVSNAQRRQDGFPGTSATVT